MQHPGFFERAGPFAIAELGRHVEAETIAASDLQIKNVTTLRNAARDDIAFFSNRKYLSQLTKTQAGACLIAPAFAEHVPDGTARLVVDDPYRAFATVLTLFYPESDHSLIAEGETSESISPSAKIEADVVIEPNVVIGPEAHIGSGTRISAGAVIGYRSMIGRNCFIGPRACIIHSLIGDNVTIHSGASLGQDGFGFSMGPMGHKKVPQIGRVIVQDHVDIGANTTIDRGALDDTIIGEGTKIDNLVQIGHNVVIGRHCIIAGMAGLAGSCELGDFVAMGGQSGIAGHLKIGDGAQIAGTAHPISDVAAGAKMGGTPARAYNDWARDQVNMRRLRRKIND